MRLNESFLNLWVNIIFHCCCLETENNKHEPQSVNENSNDMCKHNKQDSVFWVREEKLCNVVEISCSVYVNFQKENTVNS